MPDKDKGGIFGFGLLGSRDRMERCRKTNAPEDSEKTIRICKLLREAREDELQAKGLYLEITAAINDLPPHQREEWHIIL